MNREEAIEVVRKNYPHVGSSGTEFETALRELIHELRESEDERIRKAIESIIRVYGKTQGEWIAGYDMDTLVIHLRNAFVSLEKQKEQKHPNGCFTCDEYKKGYKAGRLNGFTAGYNKAMKEQKPAEWGEDERIRKELIDFVNHYRHNTDLTAEQAEWCKKAIAHLEKQKEKSEIPVNASACSKKPNDRSELNDFEIRLMDCMLSAQQYRQGSIDWDIVKSWAEELSGLIEQPNKEWSEEDEKQIAQIERIVKNAGCVKMLQDKIHNWFKSLRPSWKPSEEQMEALERLVKYPFDSYELSLAKHEHLAEVVSQLKKLM